MGLLKTLLSKKDKVSRRQHHFLPIAGGFQSTGEKTRWSTDMKSGGHVAGMPDRSEAGFRLSSGWLVCEKSSPRHAAEDVGAKLRLPSCLCCR